ncbi:hypothetical protein DE167_001444 [Clostridium beijerinckii]|uniref:Uncharacterized protein n=1 Tax=Clostridium beijerinckii TaxID=1520 RepID=A0AAX0B900_CLOBE|nr:hypothetical protein [Clostridium beijerinckii]NYC70978.1 hypothetical protein [Clostridium beijerinckii]
MFRRTRETSLGMSKWDDVPIYACSKFIWTSKMEQRLIKTYQQLIFQCLTSHICILFLCFAITLSDSPIHLIIYDLDTEHKEKHIFLIMVYIRKEGLAFVEVLHREFSCRHFFSRSCSSFACPVLCHRSMQKWVRLLLLEIHSKILSNPNKFMIFLSVFIYITLGI